MAKSEDGDRARAEFIRQQVEFRKLLRETHELHQASLDMRKRAIQNDIAFLKVLQGAGDDTWASADELKELNQQLSKTDPALN